MRRFWSTMLCLALFLITASLFSTSAFADTWKNPNGSKPFSTDSRLAPATPCGPSVATQLQPIWIKAGKQMKVKWQILAAITKVESDFGCNMGPSSAGAKGWTQFMPSTWDRWGMDADGDGKADPANSVDAIYSTARYLRASGAPEDYRKAIFAYNHADWYVNKVLETADTFGEVNTEDFGEVARLSKYARKLQGEVKASEKKFKTAKREEHKMLKQVRLGQAQYKIVEKASSKAQRESKEWKQKLESETNDYISLASGVSAEVKPQTGDENVLNYMANSNSQDAVLVYQSTSSLLDQQNAALQSLRNTSVKAQEKSAKAWKLLQKQNEINRKKVENLLVAQTNKKDKQVALRKIKADQRVYQKTVKEWERKFGDLGTISDNPFDTDLDGSVYQRMITAAKQELRLGVREIPDGSNNSPDIARYRTATEGNPGPGAWCGYFVSYLAKRAGSPLGPGGSGFGSVDAMMNFAKERHQFIEDPLQARPGDIIFWNQHVGLVVDVEDGHITTIEGNSSNAVVQRENREKGSLGLWRIPNKK